MTRKLLYVAVAAVIAAAGAAVALAIYLDRWSNQPLAIAAPTTIILEPGQSVTQFARHMQRRELLDSPRLLVWYSRWRGLDTRLQAGEYALAVATTPDVLLNAMADGDVVQHQVQLLEGTTVTQVLEVLRQAGELEHTLQAQTPVALHAELGLDARFAEGMFFPDTYTFTRGATDRSILMRAHEAMLNRAQHAWDNRADDLSLNDVEELVILASIVEKETGRAADRGKISQVFHLRLEKGMLLQTDPTVIYGLGDSFDGNLTRAHLRQDTPFNSYTRRGLPPSAIALPSAASLEAAAHPEPGDYLYFVARGDGSSQFSRTLAEHNAAVRRYQLGKGSS